MARSSYEVIIRTSLDDKSLKRGQREHTSTFNKIAADAEKAARREAAAFEKSARDQLRAVESLQRQRSAALFAAWKAEQREFEKSQRAQVKAAEKAEAEKTRMVQHHASLNQRAVEVATRGMIAAWQAVKVVAVGVFAGIVAAGVGLGAAISKAMSFDVLERSLEIVAGTFEKAQAQLVRLKELARLPGLGLREAIEASIALQIGFQTSIKDTTTRMQLSEKVIQQFSNAIALTGGGPEVFQRVITQLGQMSNAGKVLMTDLRPIIQAAPALGQSLVNAFGTISPEEINKLGLSTEEFTRRWLTALETLPRATDSAANAWTNFTNAFDQALVKIGKPFLGPLTKALNVLEPLLDQVGTLAGEVFTKLGQDGAQLWANLPATTKAAFADMLSTVSDLGGQIVQWFKDNYALILGAVFTTLNKIAEFWGTYGAQIKQEAKVLLEGLLDVFKAGLLILNGDWKKAWQTLGDELAKQAPVVTRILITLLHVAASAVIASKDIIAKAGVALGVALAEGVWNGIKQSDTASRIRTWAAEMVIAARSALSIRSPSLVFFKIGQEIAAGVYLGIESGKERVQQTLIDLTDTARLGFTTRDRKVGNKPQEDAAKRIADELTRQSQAIRALAGKETEVQRINKLLADPNVARIIDQRTAAILRQNAAIEDSIAAAQGATRPRLAGPGGLTRSRQVNTPDAVDVQIAHVYSGILDDLNSKIARHSQLTQVQITLQQLEAAGLNDLTDARAQEALQIAAQLDAESELFRMREKVRDVASDISSIFANAVEDWSGSFGKFFKSIGRGFADMLKHMIASVVFSKLQNVFSSLLGRIFNVPMQGGASGGGLGSIFSGGTPGFGGGGNILQSLFGGGGSSLTSGLGAPPSASAQSTTWSEFGRVIAANQPSAGAGAQGALGLSSLASSLPAMGIAYGAATWMSILSGQPVSNFQAITGGGVLGFFVNRSIRRRQEEKKRDAISHDTGTAIWQLIGEARNIGMSASMARWNEIASNYASQIAQIKDGKTRKHAQLQWTNDFLPLLKIVQQRAAEGEKAKAFSSAFIPTFAGGAVFRSDFFLPKAAHGLMNIPGAFDRKDDLLMRVSRGEHVAVMNPAQFSRIGGSRTFQEAGVPALQSGGHSSPSTARGEKRDIVFQVPNDMSGQIVKAMLNGLQSSDGERVIVQTMGKHVDNTRMSGFAGKVANVLTNRT